jgi:hypothetical protein
MEMLGEQSSAAATLEKRPSDRRTLPAASLGTIPNPDRDPWNLSRPVSYEQLLSTPSPFKGGQHA